MTCVFVGTISTNKPFLAEPIWDCVAFYGSMSHYTHYTVLWSTTTYSCNGELGEFVKHTCSCVKYQGLTPYVQETRARKKLLSAIELKVIGVGDI